MAKRVWIYQSDRVLNDSESKEIETLGKQFCDDWQAHGAKLCAEIKVLHNAFIVVRLDEAVANATGCSIDASVEFIKKMGAQYKVDFFNRLNVAYVVKDAIQISHSSELEALFLSDRITEETICFNNLVANTEEMEINWKQPLKDHWSFRTIKSIKTV